MRMFLSLFLVLSITSVNAQLDSCGLNKKATLNPYEVVFLNQYYSNQRDTFDFENKMVAYVTGPSGRSITDKVDFFNNVKTWNLRDDRISTMLIILTAEEKCSSGGFDAILTIWVKVFTNGRRKKVIKKLGKMDSGGKIAVGYRLENFHKAGTTAWLKASYEEYKGNDELKVRIPDSRIAGINKALQSLAPKKHKQRKVTGILYGLELCDGAACYCLVLSKSMLIDVSRGVEYKLTEKEYNNLALLFAPPE